jgi:plastocyanin
MILGHVPEATAPTSATIIISKGAQTHGYTTKVVTISQGGTLSVLNRDTQEHTVTADAVNRNDVPLFDKYVEPGTETTIAAASKLAAGRYTFHCRFHAAMIGTLIVEGGSGGTTGVIPHFTLPLKRPPVIRSAKIHLVARKAAVRVLPTGPKTTMWTFGGSYPAPTIIRPAGHDTKLLLTNRLPKRAGALTLHFSRRPPHVAGRRAARPLPRPTPPQQDLRLPAD